MKTSHALLIAGVLAVCSGCPKKRKLTLPPTATTPAPMRWAEGTYAGEAEGEGTGTLHIHALASALYMIWLGEEHPRVWIVDVDPDVSTLRARSYVGIGGAPGDVTFTVMSEADDVLVFGGGGDPRALLTIRRTDAGELALLEAGTQTPFIASELKPVAAAPAPILERADRAFAADNRERGAEAWAASAAPRGAFYDDGGAIVGPEALEQVYTRVLEELDMRWEPVVSGLSASGRFGFTVGTDLVTSRRDEQSVRGTYVTIWEVQFDGTPKWLFSTGR